MSQQTGNRQLVDGFGRAVGGALLFALPLLMTMEMWRLSLAVDRYRVLALALGSVLLVVGLARHLGPTEEGGWQSGLVDAGVAFVAAAVAVAVVLTAVGVLDWHRDWRDPTSILVLEMAPAAVGASYARAQLGRDSPSPGRADTGTSSS